MVLLNEGVEHVLLQAGDLLISVDVFEVAALLQALRELSHPRIAALHIGHEDSVRDSENRAAELQVVCEAAAADNFHDFVKVLVSLSEPMALLIDYVAAAVGQQVVG